MRTRPNGQNYRFFISISLITAMALIWGCSDKPKQSPAPSVEEAAPAAPEPLSLEITPSDATNLTVLRLKVTGFEPKEAQIEWLVNKRPFPTPDPMEFSASAAKKGSSVQVRAKVKGRVLLSQVIEIRNAPPELTHVKILPEVFKAGDTLSIEVRAKDPDEDDVSVMYEWTKNGQPAGTSESIEGTVKRGDKISIKITPFDGELYGSPIALKREILNMPPQFIENKNFSFDGLRYTYNVKASDPDGDPLTYSIKEGPAGAKIDPLTGLLSWDVPAEFSGKAPITVSVTDGNGGEALQTFNVTIGGGKK